MASQTTTKAIQRFDLHTQFFFFFILLNREISIRVTRKIYKYERSPGAIANLSLLLGIGYELEIKVPITVAEKNKIDQSVEILRTELEFLKAAGTLRPEQFASITAQLPSPGGSTSNYIDARYGNPNIVSPDLPQTIAKQAQDPNHPANPDHEKHKEWASDLAKKFGNAVVFGSGSTLGADMVNSVWHTVV